MIDNFSLGLTHVLMLIAAWRLLGMPGLNPQSPDATRPRAGDPE